MTLSKLPHTVKVGVSRGIMKKQSILGLDCNISEEVDENGKIRNADDFKEVLENVLSNR
jgi:hypothetical protein